MVNNIFVNRGTLKSLFLLVFLLTSLQARATLFHNFFLIGLMIFLSIEGGKSIYSTIF